MKKLFAAILTLCIFLSFCACDAERGEENTLTATEIKPEAAPTESAKNDATEPTEAGTTTPVLEGNTYVLTALNAQITVAEEYSVYALNSGFTDQMCQAQGIDSAAKMTQYLQICGYDMYILPEKDSFLDPSFVVSVRIKEKDYGCENFKDLNDIDFKQLADSLVVGFGVSEYTVYENDTAKYVVFNCKIIEEECRYVTILDGKMVYFIVQTDGQTAPTDHHARICAILDTLKVQ